MRQKGRDCEPRVLIKNDASFVRHRTLATGIETSLRLPNVSVFHPASLGMYHMLVELFEETYSDGPA